MILQAPLWLILIPLAAGAVWIFRAWHLAKPLRILLFLLFTLVLTQPALQNHFARKLFLLVDRSPSISLADAAKIQEWEGLVRNAQQTGDELQIIDFAEVAALRRANQSSGLERAGNDSNLLLAVQTALATIGSKADGSENPGARLAVFTDGYVTSSLSELLHVLNDSKIALDLRLTPPVSGDDLRIDRFSARTETLPGEPFNIEITIRGRGSEPVSVSLTRDGQPVYSKVVGLEDGLKALALNDTLGTPGAHRYEISVTGNDKLPGNNHAVLWVTVRGEPAVLLLSIDDTAPLANLFQSFGYRVRAVSKSDELRKLSGSDLIGIHTVVLANVPAADLSRDFQRAVQGFVSNEGGGFLMFGGQQSFGSGGYFASPIEEILPVSLESRSDIKLAASALSFVLDRSGSMGAQVMGGITTVRKMDLANEGTAKSISLLTRKDEVSVLAVDTEPETVIPLQQVGNNSISIEGRVRSISVGGGGIYVYEGIKAGWNELKKSKAKTKHLVLFSDAADSEEGEGWEKVVAEMNSAGATLSVIGLGTRSDSDSQLLDDIARGGKGRFYLVDNPMDLPAVFSSEVASVARALFITDPSTVQGSPLWGEISSAPISWPHAVPAYNLTYDKPEMPISLAAQDEWKSPLVATSIFGAGRSAAVAFPVTGTYGNWVSGWDQGGAFLSTLLKWVRRPLTPSGVRVITRRSGVNAVRLQVSIDPEFIRQRPAVTPKFYLIAEDGSVSSGAWSSVAGTEYQAELELPSSGVLRGVVNVGVAVPFGPISQSVSPEWQLNSSTRQKLREVAVASGGSELPVLDGIWNRIQTGKIRPLSEYVLLLTAFVLLLEAFAVRFGMWQSWRIRKGTAAFVRQKSDELKAPGAKVQRFITKPTLPTGLSASRNIPLETVEAPPDQAQVPAPESSLTAALKRAKRSTDRK